MATYSDSFNRADENLTTPWAASVGAGAAIVSNVVKAATGSGYRISAVTGETFDNDQDAQVTLVAVNTADYAGPCVRMDGSGNGYFMSCQFADGRVYLYRMDAGVQTSLGFISSTPVATDTVKLGVVGTTFTYYLNDVSQGTWSDATHSSGAPGIGFNPGGSNNTTVDDFTAEGLAGGPAIDDVDTDEIVTDDQTSVSLTVSGFGGNLDDVELYETTLATAEALSFSGTDPSYTFDMPNVQSYTSATSGLPFTTTSYQLQIRAARDTGPESAVLNITRNPPSGSFVVELASVNNAANACVTAGFTGTPPDGSQLVWAAPSNPADPAYFTVDAQAICTTNIINGTQDLDYYDSISGLWEQFTVTFVDGIIVGITPVFASVRDSIQSPTRATVRKTVR